VDLVTYVSTELGAWQKALRLQDWRITAEVVDGLATPDGQPAYGLCWPCVDNKTALIQIDAGAGDEARNTIIHELLHLHLAPFQNRSPTARAAEEQAVWAIEGLIAQLMANGGELRARLVARAHVGGAVARGRAKAGTVWLARLDAGRKRLAPPQRRAVEARNMANGVSGALEQIRIWAESSTDEKIKGLAEQLAAAVEEKAGAIGLDTAAGGTDEGSGEGGGESAATVPPMGMSGNPTEDTSTPVSDTPEDKPMTRADARKMLAEERARAQVFAAAEKHREGFTPRMRAQLEDMPLARAQAIVEALPWKARRPEAGSQNDKQNGAQGAQNDAGRELDVRTLIRVEAVDRANGIDPKKVEAVRARLGTEDDPRVVSMKSLLDKRKAKAAPAQ
jgi:hypothetical protein